MAAGKEASGEEEGDAGEERGARERGWALFFSELVSCAKRDCGR